MSLNFATCMGVLVAILMAVSGAAAVVYCLRWLLFARRVQGIVIGVRHRAGAEFVVAYQYMDEAGVIQEAASLAGPTLPDEQKTGARVRLMVFVGRPDMVRESNSSLFVLLFSFLLVFLPASWILALNLMPLWPAVIVAATATVAGAALVVRWPAESRNHFAGYGPVERIEDISPERLEAARGAEKDRSRD
jgi:hypothetical protein